MQRYLGFFHGYLKAFRGRHRVQDSNLIDGSSLHQVKPIGLASRLIMGLATDKNNGPGDRLARTAGISIGSQLDRAWL